MESRVLLFLKKNFENHRESFVTCYLYFSSYNKVFTWL